MKTKQEIIAELKLENPTLKVGNDDDGYIQLSADEYETTINEWAEKRLTKLAKEVEVEVKAAQRQALLSRLGITEEEAAILLGGN